MYGCSASVYVCTCHICAREDQMREHWIKLYDSLNDRCSPTPHPSSSASECLVSILVAIFGGRRCGLSGGGASPGMGFESLNDFWHCELILSASALQFKLWALSFLLQAPCLSAALPPGMMVMNSYPLGTVSSNKPYLSVVTLVMAFYHSHRKVSSMRGSGITAGFKPPRGCWEPNLLQQQQILLTAESRLQPHHIRF